MGVEPGIGVGDNSGCEPADSRRRGRLARVGGRDRDRRRGGSLRTRRPVGLDRSRARRDPLDAAAVRALRPSVRRLRRAGHVAAAACHSARSAAPLGVAVWWTGSPVGYAYSTDWRTLAPTAATGWAGEAAALVVLWLLLSHAVVATLGRMPSPRPVGASSMAGALAAVSAGLGLAVVQTGVAAVLGTDLVGSDAGPHSVPSGATTEALQASWSPPTRRWCSPRTCTTSR
jgi:hypothetical protein